MKPQQTVRPMNRYNIVEHFVSINGEGPKSGELSLFIRFKGCNLNCSYCDTKWANESDVIYKAMTKEQIVSLINQSGVLNVTITGGEPLYQNEIIQLLRYLSENTKKNIEIETNGSINIKDVKDIERSPCLTMDYKLPSSGEEYKMDLENFKYLTGSDSLKFVIGDFIDLKRAEELIYMYELQGRVNIFFSPVYGKIKIEEIVSFIKERELMGVKFQLQLHKYVWHPDKIGV